MDVEPAAARCDGFHAFQTEYPSTNELDLDVQQSQADDNEHFDTQNLPLLPHIMAVQMLDNARQVWVGSLIQG